MNVRKIIQEELKKVFEGVGNDYYNRYPDFFDPLFNPNVGSYPPIGQHSYGKMVKEDTLEEDYPEMFKMEEFKSLTTFKERIRYCESFLERIGSGSSRIAYRIDDKMVLKLAKNKKGIAQNEVEVDTSEGLGHLVANIYNSDENNLWVEMELAKKVSKGDFERVTGFSFNDYKKAIHNYSIDTVDFQGRKVSGPPEEVVEMMWDDEFAKGMLQYMPDYSVPAADLMKLSSYGIVNREWGEDIVLIDYGFNEDVQNNYY